MSYTKRLSAAENRAAKATRIFEKLEAEYLAVAQEARELHDELQVEIDHLARLRDAALNAGLKNEDRAVKVRETFL